MLPTLFMFYCLKIITRQQCINTETRVLENVRVRSHYQATNIMLKKLDSVPRMARYRFALNILSSFRAKNGYSYSIHCAAITFSYTHVGKDINPGRRKLELFVSKLICST